ncbi:MAG TPA: histidine kinase dimerization/phosphoacceptor domain -containing protein [Cryomorphaceae bacterium]|nr:histidine kinase dimerization/phosphoacceptor domain -containing protein [Cryomorphaceae bacterium]
MRLLNVAICLCLIFNQGVQAQPSSVDSLEALLEIEPEEERRFELLQELVDQASVRNYDEALPYARQGYLSAKQTEAAKWIPRFSEMKGRIHANLGQLDSAEFLFEEAFEGYTAAGDQKGRATTLFKIAWLHQRRGEYDLGMDANLKALRIMEEIDDQPGIVNALGRVAGDLYNQEKPEESLEYALRAIDLSRKGGYDEEMPYLLYYAGYAAIGLGDYEASLGYWDEALEWVEKLDMGNAQMADMSNGRGNALKKLERYPEAIAAYELTLESAEKANYYGGMYTATANLGEVHMRQGNYEEALEYQLLTVERQEEGEMWMSLTENYGHVSTIYENLGDYKNALLYQKKAREMRDQTASEQSDAAMSELRTQYETEKKEATIALQETTIGQQRTVQWMGVGVLGLLALFAASAYRNAGIRKKSNALLTAKNAENELLLKEIHHRVKNNLEVVSSLLALQSSQVDDEKVKEAMREGQNRVHSIGIVHQKLYQGTNLGAVEMKDYFLNLSGNILDTFGADDRVKIECAMNQLELDIDTAVPLGLIANEILTNSLKYAFPEGRKGKIEIKLEKTPDDVLRLAIIDDGVGKGQPAVGGTGFGGQLVALLAQQLRGKLREETDRGTAVYFEFKPKIAA